MPTINVVSKANALKIKSNNSGSRIMKYCNGKYAWNGSAKYYHERVVEVGDHILAIYVERRQDANGPYARMMCVTSL